jgi:hypothetical protein
MRTAEVILHADLGLNLRRLAAWKDGRGWSHDVQPTDLGGFGGDFAGNVAANFLNFTLKSLARVGGGDPEAKAVLAARVADFIFVPCRPKAFDLAAIEATADLVNTNGKPAYVVLMAGPPRAPLVHKEAADLIQTTFGLPLGPVALPERAAYHHSTAQGRTAGQAFPDSKAAGEVAALWRRTCAQLHLSTREPVHAALPE